MIGEVYPSTSTENKITIDVEIRNLIKIEANKHVIMLVGLPDGLERHYQNVLAWGGTIKNLIIVDISVETIKLLENYHDENLSHYDRPLFVVSDLNKILETWDRGQIGVIDFDGTTGIQAQYHLRTLLHAERLRADYLIIIASARVQDPGMIAFGEMLPFGERRVYVSKEEQEKTRSNYNKSYTQTMYTFKSTHGILEALIEGRGHAIIKSQAYKGVSPMVLSAIKLSKVDPRSYLESIKSRHGGWLFDDELDLAEIGCDIEHQLEHQQSEKIKDLFKCLRDRYGKYFPSDDWWMKYEPENFKIRHPERYRTAMCKNGSRIRPCIFTLVELDELTEWYRHCLAVADGDSRIIKQMVETYSKDHYRDYAVVQAKLSKLGLWVKLYKTGSRTRQRIK